METIPPPPSKIEQIVNLFADVRRTGPRQYKARCPGPLHRRGDRGPSLDFREGDDGRVLMLCRIGCPTEEVLKAAGLDWQDLFPGPFTRKQAREAERRRQIAEVEARAPRRERRLLADRHRKVNELLQVMGARLAEMPEGKEGDELATVFHTTIDRIHEIETVYADAEAQGFHDRLVRFRELHHIDSQHLLARYGLPHDRSTMEAA
jgi:hypothetical protein